MVGAVALVDAGAVGEWVEKYVLVVTTLGSDETADNYRIWWERGRKKMCSCHYIKSAEDILLVRPY